MHFHLVWLLQQEKRALNWYSLNLRRRNGPSCRENGLFLFARAEFLNFCRNWNKDSVTKLLQIGSWNKCRPAKDVKSKEMIAGENGVNFSLKSVLIWYYRKFFTTLFQKLKNQLTQEELKLGEARIMQTLPSETIRQLQREKCVISYKLFM